MKTRTFSTLALVSLVAATVVGGQVAQASSTELESTGKVTVIDGTAGGPDQPVVDPEKPGETIDPGEDIDVNPTTGALALEAVSKLDFGTIQTSANTIMKTAAALSDLTQTIDGTTTAVTGTRGALVQFADVRAGGASGTYGYTVQAKMTQQFMNTASEKLTGATITYANPQLVAEDGNTNTAPSGLASTFEIGITGQDAGGNDESAAQTVVTADKTAKEGKGRWVVEFGNTTAGNAADSVTLTVPSATAASMAATDYTAKIQWSIVAAP